MIRRALRLLQHGRLSRKSTMLVLTARAGTESFMSLAADDTTAIRVCGDGLEVSCVEGLVWITQAGDPSDHVLAAGDALWLSGNGPTVAMAFSDCRIRTRPTSMATIWNARASFAASGVVLE